MHPIISALRKHFAGPRQQTIVIGLHRSWDFYDRLYGGPQSYDPRIGFPELFRAIDATKCPPPPWWDELPAMWGCNESHKAVIARALSDGTERLFIMEDDCAFTDDAGAKLDAFMRDVPADWDAIMLGGQVSVHDGHTTPVTPLVSKCVQVERLHAYGLTRKGMEVFYHALCEPGNTQPNDYRWGDLQEQGKLNVYRIEPFVAYQTDGRSSISGRVEPQRIWDDRVDVRLRDPASIPVISLVCPFDVMERLRDAGILSNGGESPPYMGQIVPGRVEKGERALADLTLSHFQNDPVAAKRVMDALRGDAAFHRHGPFAIWHPETHVPYPGAVQVAAETYDAARAILEGLANN